MATGLTQIMKATLYFQYKANGWSEGYWLTILDYDAGDILLSALAQYRRSFMGLGVEIIRANIAIAGKPAAASWLTGTPIGFMPSMKKEPTESDELYRPSDPNLAVVYRCETATRKFSNRLFRGMPDQLVYDFKYVTSQPLPRAVGLELVPPGNPADQSPDLYRASFLRWLLTNTVRASSTPKGVVPRLWNTEAFATMKVHAIGRHKTGAPVGVSKGRLPAFPV